MWPKRLCREERTRISGICERRVCRLHRQQTLDSTKCSPRAGIQIRTGSTRRKRDAVEKDIGRERRAINLFKTSKGRNLDLCEQLERAHRRYGYVAPKRLVGFKKKGRIYSSLIPDKGRLEFKAKHCPICLAMKCVSVSYLYIDSYRVSAESRAGKREL